ncbi:MAG: T9SS type A sorting domain-containing protein [Chitinophagales bacterium]|nr:T9SS type A sorting domain-containing protein [Sphingobacteriales bacterium]
MIQQFEGNVANGSPSDNDVAIGIDGTILSAVNTNIQIFTEAGILRTSKSLATLASSLGSLSQNSDPRVLYDPKADRYIMVWFSGVVSSTNKIIVGFTKTNDPAGAWNFYTLNGASFNDSTWSDYPIISFSNKDLFITFNQVKDNISWTIGFKQSVIWQLDKQKGYDGDSLKFTLWSDIKNNGRNLRNICPAKYQTTEPDSNMYFLSVRNVDASNDTIFLLEINNTYASGKAQLKQRILKSPVKYGFPPNAFQSKVGGKIQQLMTNDARVLAAIYENGNIHFGSNSILQGDITSTVMLSTIKNVQTTNPKVEAKLLNIPGMEFGYPSMAYTGVDPLDHKVMYSFSHCRIDSFPGTSVIYKDAKDNFSKLLIIKEGESIVNAFSDSIERWGDYTNMQKLYQYENQAFLTGSYGKTNRMATWLAKLEVNDTTKGTKPTNSLRQSNLETTVAVYPNPIKNSLFQVNFEIDDNEDLSFDLYDNIGRKVVRLLDTKGYKGKNEFSFRTNDLPKGQYILQIKGDKTTNIAKTVLVE